MALHAEGHLQVVGVDDLEAYQHTPIRRASRGSASSHYSEQEAKTPSS